MIMVVVRGERGPGRVALALLLGLAVAEPACAVRVADIYAASVPLAADAADGQQAAFGEALRRVLVKATGRAEAAAAASRFGDPAALVQQFRREAGGSLWAQFDPAGVRRGLDAASLPLWGDDRPLTAVWLAYDRGGGERDVLGSSSGEASEAVALRRELLQAAAARAVPVVLPLRDSQEISAVAFADVWGDFTETVVRASARYQADAVLIGRARLAPPGMTDVRWTLVLGAERLEWRGGIADGPHGLAERLSQRLAATAGAAASAPAAARLAVSGVATMDQYGEVLSYLAGLDVVENVTVAGMADGELLLELRLRMERDQLVRALAVRRVIEPINGEGAAADTVLRYQLAGVP